MNILVVGGAGYIGSHMVKLLHERGHVVTTLDNFCAGYPDAVLAGRVIEMDLADLLGLRRVFRETEFDCVMHFAAHALVGESMNAPAKYYRNNVANTMNLLDAMRERGVGSFVFSSTCAVYGEPRYLPIDEAHPLAPINPYGRSKRVVEQMLGDLDAAHGLRSVCLRYFNAAGADPEGRLGERHEPETHLIPLVLGAAAGSRGPAKVFGDDYETPDGTCVRDYIHVTDLCEAHLLAVDWMTSGNQSAIFNLGNGHGFSVRQVIDTAEAVTGRSVPREIARRREGDPARLVADAARAREALGWMPRYPDLHTIIEHAWRWELKRAGRTATRAGS